jgi:putative transposase
MSNYKRVFVENSYLFLTIITYNRNPILVKNIELLGESFKRAKEKYNFEIYCSVIMPEHMHLLLKPEKIEEYPKIIFAVKYHFSKNLPNSNENLSQSKIAKKEKGIWHRRYYEHTIRDEKDLYNHLDYIHYNPMKHKVAKNVKDWEYSSFHKFVKNEQYEKNWGTFDDIKDIAGFDLG